MQKRKRTSGISPHWDMTIIDAAPGVIELSSCAAADIDNDGYEEMVTGGKGGLLWYRPTTGEKGKISDGNFVVGLAIADLDYDGKMEIVAGEWDPEKQANLLSLFILHDAHSMSWRRSLVDAACTGSVHDVVVCDIDKDGENELIANAAYAPLWGLFIYKRDGNIARPWRKYAVQQGNSEEGLDCADLNGDGKLEIVSGVAWYTYKGKNPCGAEWTRHVYAHDFREMVRLACVDITGNGRPDIVTCDSEFVDGRISWFENRTAEDPLQPFIEHPIDKGLNFAHSLQAERSGKNKVSIFCAEMEAGGWWQPYNRDARLMEYTTGDHGKTWKRGILYQGCGTHQALRYDIDHDGEKEILGKTWGELVDIQNVQIYKRKSSPSPIDGWKHVFVDRDKPYTSVDILAADVDGDGREDIVTGAWWYKNPGWRRYEIPGIAQIINACDIDSDGKMELLAIKGKGLSHKGFYENLNSELVWLKPLDPLNGKWEQRTIGIGHGDWPHGSLIGPFGKDGRTAAIAGYHSAHDGTEHHCPEIFEAPEDLTEGQWTKKDLAPIFYGEEFRAIDFDNDGELEILAGPYLLKRFNGQWKLQKLLEGFAAARTGIFHLPGSPLSHVVMGEEVFDYANRKVPFSRLIWLKNPGVWGKSWEATVIDKVLCGHSVGVIDIDNDGQDEIICGEHYPFAPYRSRCGLYVYKRADRTGKQWTRHALDSRFEHHDGARIINIAKGKQGILSIGWTEERYVHLWYPAE